jgi:hypothetical protein
MNAPSRNAPPPGARRMREALAHRQPDRPPVDFGSTSVSGMHVSCVAALRRHYGLGNAPVRVIDPGQMLGEIGEDLKAIIGIDTEAVRPRNCRYGFPLGAWKPFRLDDGLEVLVPGGFTFTRDENGDTLLYPQSDTSVPPSARMPNGGYFFDNIIRQPPIDDDKLDPADNLEEFRLLSETQVDYFEAEARRARATGRAVVASFGGTGFGDIAAVPGAGLKHPRGIRDVTEWYISINTRRDYVRRVFERQCEIALANLELLARRLGGLVDVVNLCGTDFGTQTSSFCSVATFRELWAPHYRRVNALIHRLTPWKTFKHSCGAVWKFIPAFLDCGFDILNPVQCSAAGMDPARLKAEFGAQLVFWGGGVDTQSTLPFGTPGEVREQVLRRLEVFARDGGFVFNTVHNIQACTPVENIVALIGALHEFGGKL